MLLTVGDLKGTSAIKSATRLTKMKLDTIIADLKKTPKIYEHVTQPLSFLFEFCYMSKYEQRLHLST